MSSRGASTASRITDTPGPRPRDHNPGRNWPRRVRAMATTGMWIRKIELHAKCSSISPPRVGPTATPSPETADQIPARRSIGSDIAPAQGAALQLLRRQAATVRHHHRRRTCQGRRRRPRVVPTRTRHRRVHRTRVRLPRRQPSPRASTAMGASRLARSPRSSTSTPNTGPLCSQSKHGTTASPPRS